MGTPLNVLIIEDSEDDTLLIMRELRRGGYEPKYERVETAKAMKEALDKQKWDIIISDYIMPRFNGLDALKLMKEKGLDLPFILVSGLIGEEKAVKTMKAGADDFIMKSNLSRLGPAVKRELSEAKMRQEHKSAEKALSEAQQYLEAVVETAPSLIVLTDPDGHIILFNRACEELTGYKREEVLGKTIPELFLPAEWIPVVQKRFADPNAPEVRAPHENPWRTKSGEERLIEWRCTVMPSPEDGRPFILGTGIDITEHRQKEKALRESEKKYRDLVDNALVGIYKTNLKGDILYVNEALSRMLEFESPEEMMAGGVLKRYKNTKDREVLIDRLKKENKIKDFEVELLTKTDKIKHVILSASIEGNFISGMIMDITVRKRAEEALQESENKFRDLAERSLVGFYLIQDGVFKYVNPKLAEMFDYPVEEIIDKKSPRDFTLPDDWPAMEESLTKRLSGEIKEAHFTFRGITKNNNIIYLESYGTRTMYQGRPAVIGTLLDITQKKQTEKEIKKRIQELEEFYNIAIGRELRMKELKEEIEALKEELEKYKKT